MQNSSLQNQLYPGWYYENYENYFLIFCKNKLNKGNNTRGSTHSLSIKMVGNGDIKHRELVCRWYS